MLANKGNHTTLKTTSPLTTNTPGTMGRATKIDTPNEPMDASKATGDEVTSHKATKTKDLASEDPPNSSNKEEPVVDAGVMARFNSRRRGGRATSHSGTTLKEDDDADKSEDIIINVDKNNVADNEVSPGAVSAGVTARFNRRRLGTGESEASREELVSGLIEARLVNTRRPAPAPEENVSEDEESADGVQEIGIATVVQKENGSARTRNYFLMGLALIVAVVIIVLVAVSVRPGSTDTEPATQASTTTTTAQEDTPIGGDQQAKQNRVHTFHVAYVTAQATCSDNIQVLLACEDGKLEDFPYALGCARDDSDGKKRGAFCLLPANATYALDIECSFVVEEDGTGDVKDAAAISVTLVKNNSTSEDEQCYDHVAFNMARYCKGDLVFSSCLSSTQMPETTATEEEEIVCGFSNEWIGFDDCKTGGCPKSVDASFGRERCHESKRGVDDFDEVVAAHDFESLGTEWIAEQILGN